MFDAEETFAAAEQQMYMRVIYDTVAAGMCPFRPAPVYVSDDYDLDFQKHVIKFEFPSINENFKFELGRNEFSDPYGYWDRWLPLGRRITDEIRNRPSITPEPNVILGEN